MVRRGVGSHASPPSDGGRSRGHPLSANLVAACRAVTDAIGPSALRSAESGFSTRVSSEGRSAYKRNLGLAGESAGKSVGERATARVCGRRGSH